MPEIRLDQLLDQQTDDRTPVSQVRADDFLDATTPVEVEEKDFNLMDLLDVPESLSDTWKKQGKIGYFEQARRFREGQTLSYLGNFIPGVSAGIDISNSWQNLEAIKRIQKNEYADNTVQRNKDVLRVKKYLLNLAEEQTRGFSIGGQIARGALQLPSFIGGFAATSGVAKAVGKGAAKALASIDPGKAFDLEFPEPTDMQRGLRAAGIDPASPEGINLLRSSIERKAKGDPGELSKMLDTLGVPKDAPERKQIIAQALQKKITHAPAAQTHLLLQGQVARWSSGRRGRFPPSGR